MAIKTAAERAAEIRAESDRIEAEKTAAQQAKIEAKRQANIAKFEAEISPEPVKVVVPVDSKQDESDISERISFDSLEELHDTLRSLRKDPDEAPPPPPPIPAGIAEKTRLEMEAGAKRVAYFEKLRQEQDAVKLKKMAEEKAAEGHMTPVYRANEPVQGMDQNKPFEMTRGS